MLTREKKAVKYRNEVIYFDRTSDRHEWLRSLELARLFTSIGFKRLPISLLPGLFSGCSLWCAFYFAATSLSSSVSSRANEVGREMGVTVHSRESIFFYRSRYGERERQVSHFSAWIRAPRADRKTEECCRRGRSVFLFCWIAEIKSYIVLYLYIRSEKAFFNLWAFKGLLNVTLKLESSRRITRYDAVLHYLKLEASIKFYHCRDPYLYSFWSIIENVKDFYKFTITIWTFSMIINVNVSKGKLQNELYNVSKNSISIKSRKYLSILIERATCIEINNVIFNTISIPKFPFT